MEVALFLANHWGYIGLVLQSNSTMIAAILINITIFVLIKYDENLCLH